MEAFACEIEPGRMIHAIEKPVKDHHCRDYPEDPYMKWILNPNNNKCYLTDTGINIISHKNYIT